MSFQIEPVGQLTFPTAFPIVSKQFMQTVMRTKFFFSFFLLNNKIASSGCSLEILSYRAIVKVGTAAHMGWTMFISKRPIGFASTRKPICQGKLTDGCDSVQTFSFGVLWMESYLRCDCFKQSNVYPHHSKFIELQGEGVAWTGWVADLNGRGTTKSSVFFWKDKKWD